MADQIVWILVALPVFIISGTFHEYMHAWTAKKLGDYTAVVDGRLTLNPLAHIDPFGLLLLVFARIGWMKPVSVNEYNFKDPVAGSAIVALAGPLTNLAIAIVLSFVYRIFFGGVGSSSDISFVLSSFLYVAISINVMLFVFNLIPIPPLDGHHILRALLPKEIRYLYEELAKYSIIILFALFLPISPLSNFTGPIISSVVQSVLEILL